MHSHLGGDCGGGDRVWTLRTANEKFIFLLNHFRHPLIKIFIWTSMIFPESPLLPKFIGKVKRLFWYGERETDKVILEYTSPYCKRIQFHQNVSRGFPSSRNNFRPFSKIYKTLSKKSQTTRSPQWKEVWSALLFMHEWWLHVVKMGNSTAVILYIFWNNIITVSII